MSISEVITRARGFKKQDHFAGELGISQGFLCNIEKGRRKPSIQVLKRLSKMTNKPLIYLINITHE